MQLQHAVDNWSNNSAQLIYFQQQVLWEGIIHPIKNFAKRLLSIFSGADFVTAPITDSIDYIIHDWF